MIGTVTISPNVVREVARITTLATPGVMAISERQIGRSTTEPGVYVRVQDNSVSIKLRVIAATDVPLHKLGEQIQAAVASAITEIAGMSVSTVDVSFEDVRVKA